MLESSLSSRTIFSHSFIADVKAHVGKNGNGLILPVSWLQHDFQPSNTGNMKFPFSLWITQPCSFGNTISHGLGIRWEWCAEGRNTPTTTQSCACAHCDLPVSTAVQVLGESGNSPTSPVLTEVDRLSHVTSALHCLNRSYTTSLNICL